MNNRQLTAEVSITGQEHAHVTIRVSKIERVTESDSKGNMRTVFKLEGVIFDPDEQPPPPTYGRQLELEDLRT